MILYFNVIFKNVYFALVISWNNNFIWYLLKLILFQVTLYWIHFWEIYIYVNCSFRTAEKVTDENKTEQKAVNEMMILSELSAYSLSEN